MAFSDRSVMRSPRDRSAICAIEVIRLPVRFVSWLSSSRAMVSTCWPTLRTSCATTAKPAPCAAGARTFDQRVQRQHLHLVGDLLDRLVFSQATWLTSAVNLAISVETSDSSSALAEFLDCFAIVAVRKRSSAADIGGNSSVFVLLSTFCGSTGLNESMLVPLSRIMANDWFISLVPQVVLRGQVASCLCKSNLSA